MDSRPTHRTCHWKSIKSSSFGLGRRQNPDDIAPGELSTRFRVTRINHDLWNIHGLQDGKLLTCISLSKSKCFSISQIQDELYQRLFPFKKLKVLILHSVKEGGCWDSQRLVDDLFLKFSSLEKVVLREVDGEDYFFRQGVRGEKCLEVEA
jgi:hypothetical protein